MRATPFVSASMPSHGKVILGEGPTLFNNRLLTTDARGAVIRSTDLVSGATEDIFLADHLRDQGLITRDLKIPVLGSMAPVADGRLLTALATGIYLFNLQTRAFEEFSHPEALRSIEGPHYNDGKVGPDGAFYVGGMIGGQEGAGRLLRIAGDGSFTEPLIDFPPLTTPNGMHWFQTDDPNIWDFFYVDSQYPAIQKYRHDLSRCEMTRQPDLVPLPRETFGYLDGMTGTSNGLLILALYLPQEYGLIVIDTKSAQIVERISTDAPQTTSAALSGSVLYITSAAQEYGDSDYDKFPNAGAIFKADLKRAEHPLVREASECLPQSKWVFSFTA